MGVKQWINNALHPLGYQFSHAPSIRRDIDRGMFDWLRRRNISAIIDVGANIGQFAEMIRQVFPGTMIYSFEPIHDSFLKLEEASKRLQPMRCFPWALGSGEAVGTMHQNSFSASSSLLPLGERHLKAFPQAAPSGEETVQIRTLDAVFAELSLTPPVLMKLDVQGFELNVLHGAHAMLPLVDVLILETSFVRLYEDQPLFDDVYQYLRVRSYRYAGSMGNVVDPTNGEVLQEDSVFVRNAS